MLSIRSRSLVLLLPATLMAACQSWRVPDAPLAETLGAHPDAVRITRQDLSRTTLNAPRLSGDTLIGMQQGSSPQVLVAVPLGDVRSIEVLKFNAGKTAAVVVGVGATALLVAAAASSSSGGSSGGGGGGSDGYGSGTYSCPLVYSWDGSRWRLDSGTFGGAITRVLARTDVDNLAYAVAVRDTVRLRVANELRETDHVDELTVLAVDHIAGTSVAPTPDGRIKAIGSVAAPIAARDSRGQDALAQVARLDGRAWESALVPRDTSRLDDLRDALDLTFRRPAGDVADLVLDARNTVWASFLMGELVRAQGRQVDAWYASLDADSAGAASLRRRLASEAFLSVSVLTDGRWRNQGLVWEAGPEIAKRQVVTLDLGGVRDTVLRVRLEAPAAFWTIDHVGLGTPREVPLHVHQARLGTAELAPGNDAADLLLRRDGRMLTLEPGEAANLIFTVPPVEAGMARSYVLRSHGWYRIHTAAQGEPDEDVLAGVFTRESGIARMAAVRLNGALAQLAAAR